VHFQVQETPFIGSKTLDYPIGHYILNQDGNYKLKTYSRPSKNDIVSKIDKNQNLFGAFHFVPGQLLKFLVTSSSSQKERTVIWEVQSDIYNNTFLYCTKTRSKAWFKNDGGMHYFTHFDGNKNSLLFYFYLGAYKVISGFYKNLKISDKYPIHILNNKGLVFLQDFIAPFYMFVKSDYEMEYVKINDELTDSHIIFQSEALVKHGNKTTRRLNFEFEIESKRIKRLVIMEGDYSMEAKELSTTQEKS